MREDGEESAAGERCGGTWVRCLCPHKTCYMPRCYSVLGQQAPGASGRGSEGKHFASGGGAGHSRRWASELRANKACKAPSVRTVNRVDIFYMPSFGTMPLRPTFHSLPFHALLPCLIITSCHSSSSFCMASTSLPLSLRYSGCPLAQHTVNEIYVRFFCTGTRTTRPAPDRKLTL